MKELTEAKFPRTGKEYSLEKTANGFNLRLIDLDDSLAPVFKTFEQLLELSQAGQIIFTGFEEKRNEAELILLNCMHAEKNAGYELQIAELKVSSDQLQTSLDQASEANTALQNKAVDLEQQVTELKAENANLNTIITELKEAKELLNAQ